MKMKELFKKYGCYKILHDYSELYEADFGPIRKEKLNFLEVGIFQGQSINVWLEYFPNANIYAIDTFERFSVEALPMLNHERVTYAKLDSTSKACNDYFKELGVKFDFIIDDGLHTPDGQRKTFDNLIEFTDTYYIEDVWNLEKLGKNHSWIRKHPNDFTLHKYKKLIETIEKYTVTHHDWRLKNKPDSYILKVCK
tara:strand:+ start:241 stop:828 length:588 start_codon:yes stop_codon:yes gene_type:complete